MRHLHISKQQVSAYWVNFVTILKENREFHVFVWGLKKKKKSATLTLLHCFGGGGTVRMVQLFSHAPLHQ